MHNPQKCPLCKKVLARALIPTDSIIRVICSNCGTYGISLEFYEDNFGDNYGKLTIQNLAILAHSIYRQEPNLPLLNNDFVDQVLKINNLPTASEQLNNLIIFMGTNLAGPGESITIEADTLIAKIGALSVQSVIWNITNAIDSGLIEANQAMTIFNNTTLSLRGWERFQDLQKSDNNSKKAFMAMKFGDSDLEHVFIECFKPAVARAGFTLIKLNDNPRAGLIDDRLRTEIRTSRFVIADLSHGNQGAYWEAGFGEGLGKPVIYTCKDSVFNDPIKKPHFDTNHYLSIQWNIQSLQLAREELTATIRATLPSEAKLTD